MPFPQKRTFIVLFLCCFFFTQPGDHAAAAATTSEGQIINSRQWSLEQCLDEALQNNRRRPASLYAVEMAKAQHRQALAGYWPQVGLTVGYQHWDEASNFLFPSSSMNIMGMNVQVPEQDIKFMDKESYLATLEANWLLYDGGMRKGLREQTNGQVKAMEQQVRRTELEIIDSVNRLYWGSVLADQLKEVGTTTLARMEATLTLTETMYKEGSGRVKKTDWLNNRVMVETLRSMVALLEKNEATSKAALANTMGMPWNSSVQPTDYSMPHFPFRKDLGELVGSAYQFSPDWARIDAALGAAQGAIRSAKSEHHPRLAVTGKLIKWWNDYEAGLVTEDNEERGVFTVGLELPLFKGMLTVNKIAETKARLAKLEEEKLLLKEGLGLHIRNIFLSLQAAEKSHNASQEAMTAATENRDLNTRAYQNGLVETDEVIKAQLMEAMMSAQHYKARYEHLALRSQLNLVIGTEILNRLGGALQ